MKTPTIAEIKFRTQEKAPFFFNRKTLKFFGQTMRDFKVRKSPEGRIFILAPLRRRNDGGRWIQVGYTFCEFIGDDLILPINEGDNGMVHHDHLYQIEAYIRAH